MPRITISYRRDDSIAITGRIYDRLVARYGRETVFRDVDDVEIGVDFRTHIDQELAATDIVIAIIGPNWAGPSASQSRLSNEADPVRVEIETTLRRKLPLIPVQVLGAAMPTVTQLPESLRDFAYRNAVQLDAGQDFDVHMTRLIRAVDRILGLRGDSGPVAPGARGAGGSPPPSGVSHLVIGALTGAAVLLGAGGLFYGFYQQKTSLPTTVGLVATTAPQANAPSPPPVTSAVSPTTTSPSTIAANPPLVSVERPAEIAQREATEKARAEERARQAAATKAQQDERDRQAAAAKARQEEQDRQGTATKVAPDAVNKGKAAFGNKDYAEAMRWFRMAADQGNAVAEHNIGYLYLQGFGVPKDYAEAMRWYRRAADQGNVIAQNQVGWLYQHGWGAATDYAEAMRWYRKAADQGNAPAENNIGFLFQLGLGVPPDHDQACRWYRKAAASGSGNAKTALAENGCG